MKTFLVMFAMAVALHQLTGCCCRPDDFAPPPSASVKPAKAKPKPPPEPEVAVSAMQLHDDYHKNEVLADELYKGKNLVVDGIVASIDKDFMDNVVLRLKTKNMFQGVNAYVIPEQRSEVARMTKGESTVVVCKGGGMVVGSPVLRNCKIL